MLLLDYQPDGVREAALRLFAKKAQRAVGLAGEVTIFITSSDQIRELNRRFRGKNEATDVLSFELPSKEAKAAGDIAISGEIAAANAAELGHSAETELKILVLHGLLHLAGYDHERDNGEMRVLEADLRSKLKLPIGLIERAQAKFGRARRVLRSGARVARNGRRR
ncbi:MAG TPA: rRNA maturation RNase YbeY [Terriglobales bacterium]|nr:rRNA maturation RNase YbeY [Terriglobales bacterium]